MGNTGLMDALTRVRLAENLYGDSYSDTQAGESNNI